MNKLKQVKRNTNYNDKSVDVCIYCDGDGNVLQYSFDSSQTYHSQGEPTSSYIECESCDGTGEKKQYSNATFRETDEIIKIFFTEIDKTIGRKIK